MMTYMASAIGFSFSFHYCGGSFHGICFTADTEEDCCGTKEQSNGCCEDKVVSAKFKDDHSPTFFSIIPKVILDFLPVLRMTFVHVAVQKGIHAVSINNKGPSPPALGSRGIPIYLFIRVLRL
jgi:hypothetical protein